VKRAVGEPVDVRWVWLDINGGVSLSRSGVAGEGALPVVSLPLGLIDSGCMLIGGDGPVFAEFQSLENRARERSDLLPATVPVD
jgi:hypothetical protein